MEGEDTKTSETASENIDNINKEAKGNVLRSIDNEVEKIPEEDQKEDNEAEGLEGIKTEELKEPSEKDRLILYEKGVRLKRKGNNRHALPCFLGCLQGLKDRDHFPVLPECLHNIAEIYSQEEEYDTAIQFAQAEKLYYETALITVDRDDKESAATDGGMASMSAEVNNSTQDEWSSTDAAQKAEEYEKLAHMCLKQQNPQLALDYCAKAVKIQQSCYGEQHPTTLKTLDLFTVIYAEMGKQQYKAALEKFSAAQEKESKPSKKMTEAASVSTENNTTQTKPCIKESHQTMSNKMENNKQSDDQEKPEKNRTEETQTSQDTVKLTVTSSQALLLYFIVTILLAIVLTTVLCYITQTDPKTTYNYMIRRIRFYYYYYFKIKGSNGNHYF